MINVADGNRLCGLLVNDTLLKNRMVVFDMICKDCYDPEVRRRFRRLPIIAPETYEKDTKLIDHIYEVYFNTKCKYSVVATKLIDDDRVKKYCNYIILMKDEL